MTQWLLCVGIRDKVAADIGVSSDELCEHKGTIKEIVTAIITDDGDGTGAYDAYIAKATAKVAAKATA
jgi:hypothetical protein